MILVPLRGMMLSSAIYFCLISYPAKPAMAVMPMPTVPMSNDSPWLSVIAPIATSRIMMPRIAIFVSVTSMVKLLRCGTFYRWVGM